MDAGPQRAHGGQFLEINDEELMIIIRRAFSRRIHFRSRPGRARTTKRKCRKQTRRTVSFIVVDHFASRSGCSWFAYEENSSLTMLRGSARHFVPARPRSFALLFPGSRRPRPRSVNAVETIIIEASPSPPLGSAFSNSSACSVFGSGDFF